MPELLAIGFKRTRYVRTGRFYSGTTKKEKIGLRTCDFIFLDDVIFFSKPVHTFVRTGFEKKRSGIRSWYVYRYVGRTKRGREL